MKILHISISFNALKVIRTYQIPSYNFRTQFRSTDVISTCKFGSTDTADAYSEYIKKQPYEAEVRSN